MFPQIPPFGAALSVILTDFSVPRTFLKEKGEQLSRARGTLNLSLPKRSHFLMSRKMSEDLKSIGSLLVTM